MKKILITGAGSYIGTSFEKWVMSSDFEGMYHVDTLDMINPEWNEYDFSGYDTVFHVAGIAHSDTSNVSDEVIQKYYKINSELAIETAMKAKNEGVSQFIFMSSMIVYGGMEHVTEDTVPEPANFYGNSKWKADKELQRLDSPGFKVVILRPPMIYGKDSKGNYPTLAKMAKKLPIFPKVKNCRSMLYIENLCEFIRLMVENEEHGIFFPQNEKPVCTSDMVKQIAAVSGHKIWVTGLLAPCVHIAKHFPGQIGRLCNKAFGDSYYDTGMSNYKENYRVTDFKESIEKTEG